MTLSNRNEAPTADAGDDQENIAEGATVTLSGAGTDPDAGDTLTYAWTQTGGSTVTLASAPAPTFTAPIGLTEDETLAFTLRVTDAGGLYSEDPVEVTIVATASRLTARFEEMPETHDGSDSFTFELRFSEEFGISYRTLRDHAFTVSGGEVVKANRLEPGKNVRWAITVRPSGNSDVTVELPATADCADQGAICASDDSKLSNSLEITVSVQNFAATGAPAITGTARVGETLTASTTSISDANGLTSAAFRYQWLADDIEIGGAAGSSYTLVAADRGKAIKVRVSFADDRGNAESLTSTATATVSPRSNSPAGGAPTITGTAQVGQTLTVNTSNITDSDGLANATFTYRWLADDTEISGATGSSYTLVHADRGKAIKVRVSFSDDKGNSESLSSTATGAVAPIALTAAIHGEPNLHNGLDVFTFELRFSDEFGISYTVLRDHAFTVTGGEVVKAKRIERGSNMRWRIHVRPTSNAPVTIVLPVTADCDAQGAVCAGDGRPLSNRLELTVSGPGS